MKGVVFTEFLEMVEDTFSPDMADTIIEDSDLPSGGVYTTLGTYDHEEMVQLVTHLSAHTETPVPDLLKVFGKHLFGRFAKGYPHFFADVGSAFDFLQNVEGYIHVEVRKLYADAELPSFEYDTSVPGQLVMTYSSKRAFGDLAEGLIHGCIAHFEESIDVARENVATEPRTVVRFTMTQRP